MSNIPENAGPAEPGFALGTLAIHGGQSPDPTTGAVMPPIYATSTYAQSSPGVHQGFEYSRTHNPTRFAYERCVAALEGGSRGYAFASGMAASSTVLELLDSGSHVIAMDDIYGGSYRLFERVRRRSAGLDFSFIDLTDLLPDTVAVHRRLRTPRWRRAMAVRRQLDAWRPAPARGRAFIGSEIARARAARRRTGCCRPSCTAGTGPGRG